MPVNWAVIKQDALQPPERLDGPLEVEGVRWLPGRGSKPARLLVAGQNPGGEELLQSKVFVGPSGKLLESALGQTGLRELSTYITNVVKFGTFNNEAPKAYEIRAGQNCLLHEIDEVNPEVILILGACALEAVAGRLPGNKAFKLSEVRGEFFTCERFNGIRLFATWHPAYILRQPEHENEWLADLRKVGNFLKNGHAADKQTVTYELITTAEQFGQWLVVGLQENGGSGLLCLDTEWQGARPDTPGAYLRTLQLCFANGRTAVVRFYPTATPEQPVVPENNYPGCADVKAVLATLGLYLQAGGRVFGQNISADGYWLLHHGLDLRPYTTYDTMLAEHVLDNRGPFNLTDLTLKYAPELGRYDRWLQDWVNHNPELVVGGYGAVPEELLFPYGAGDVQAPWQIARQQMPLLVQEGAMQRTGLRQEYPSLFEIEMNMALQLYELHLAGLTVDRQRLEELTALFNHKRDALRIQVGDMAAKNGFPDFNPNSHQQKVKLVYGAKSEGGLALQPIKSTGKRSKAWDWVLNQHPDVRAHYRPALDGETLDTMAGSHPLIDTLISYQRIGTICKNFLRTDEEGGIAGNLCPDGKLHADFSQLTDTGRLRSARPNVQNWPKASEGELRVIFKEERQQLEQAGKLEPKELWPPSIRSIVIAEPGCILLEADYKQAELFVLAGLAMDDVMLDALRVPGKDLHDMTTLQSFRIRIYNPDGTPYDEPQMLALAKADLPAFEKLQKELVYVDLKGKRMSRAEFKDTIRVSGKSINFGIPYGRGPEAIARQVNAETGMNVSVDEIRNGIESWKQMFHKSWDCMCRFREQALMQRYVATVWGRKRRFNRPENSGQQGQIEREGSNHPVQGTVADTLAIAMSRIAGLRRERGLTFKIINQIHDALLFSVPLGELAAAEEIVRIGMSEIDLPMPGGPLRLSVDIERFERWGEKTTKKG